MDKTKPEICLPLSEACRRLGISRTTLWKFMRAGKIAPTRYGTARVLIRESVIEKFIADSSKPLDRKSELALQPRPRVVGNDNVKGKRSA